MARRRRPARRRGRRRPSDPLLDQALTEANVQYGGEEAALGDMLKEARDTLERDINVNEASARGLRYAIDQAKPEMVGIYKRAGEDYSRAEARLNNDIRTLSSAADPYKAVIAEESASARRRLADSMTVAVKELTNRQIDAEQNRAYSNRQAQDEYKASSAKVRGKQRDLAHQKGAFAYGAYQKLKAAQQEQEFQAEKFQEQMRSTRARERQADRRLRLQARGQDISSRDRKRQRELTKRGQDMQNADRDASRRLRARGGGGRGGGGKGKSPFTQTQRRGYRQKYQKAVNTIRSDPKWHPRRSQQFVRALASRDIPEEIARAAVERVKYGGASRQLARTVRARYGFSVTVRRPKRQGGAVGRALDIGALIGR